jgi:hypothetical protein
MLYKETEETPGLVLMHALPSFPRTIARSVGYTLNPFPTMLVHASPVMPLISLATARASQHLEMRADSARRQRKVTTADDGQFPLTFLIVLSYTVPW